MAAGIPFGNYRLIRRLARGGMAEVFLASQRGPSGFERTVAVKRILPHLADDPQFVEMFMDEARLAAQLSHSNIAHIYEFGRVDDSYFIAMEYIDGCDLSAVILDGPARPLPFQHAARVIADVCAALHYAHSLTGADGKPLNLVHRDISPQNILVSFGGAVKVVDFGIAKAAVHIERTRPGVVRGKYTYMSPEQVDGKPLDGRADLFCAGIVLYELCSCDALFPRTNPMLAMRRIRAGDIPRPARGGAPLPANLEKILMRALARRREERYRNAAEMQMDLEAYLHSTSELSSSILLADYFTAHYRKLRPTGEQAAPAGTLAAGPGKDRTLGVVRANPTAPIAGVPSRPGAAAPAAEDRTAVMAEGRIEELVRASDLEGATQIRPAAASAAGTIHIATAKPPPPDEPTPSPTPVLLDLRQAVLAERSPLEGEEKTAAFLTPARPPPVPPDSVVLPIPQRGGDEPTPAVQTIDAAAGELELLTLPPVAAEDRTLETLPAASKRGPPTTIATRSPRPLRSFGRRALIVLLVTLVAVAGVAVGYLLSEPPEPLTSAGGTAALRAAADAPSSTTGRDGAAAVASRPSTDAGEASEKMGTLEVLTRPEGATITVDGSELRETTPLKRAFFAGSHTIVASYPGFEDRAHRARLDAGQTLVVNLTLRRLQPEQIVSLKRDAPKTKKKGKARPKVREKKSVALKREPGAEPATGHGTLSVVTIPWTSVFLGERKLGVTPLRARVPVGTHELRLQNAKGETFKKMVTVRPDEVTKVSWRLPGA